MNNLIVLIYRGSCLIILLINSYAFKDIQDDTFETSKQNSRNVV